jgi:hypothetical protein
MSVIPLKTSQSAKNNDICFNIMVRTKTKPFVDVRWCLATLSTIFQLNRGGQFYWWRNQRIRRKPQGLAVIFSHRQVYVKREGRTLFWLRFRFVFPAYCWFSDFRKIIFLFFYFDQWKLTLILSPYKPEISIQREIQIESNIVHVWDMYFISRCWNVIIFGWN